jgi:hypothetical protein
VSRLVWELGLSLEGESLGVKTGGWGEPIGRWLQGGGAGGAKRRSEEEENKKRARKKAKTKAAKGPKASPYSYYTILYYTHTTLLNARLICTYTLCTPHAI